MATMPSDKAPSTSKTPFLFINSPFITAKSPIIMILKTSTMNDLSNPAVSGQRPVIFRPCLATGLAYQRLILRAFTNKKFRFDVGIVQGSLKFDQKTIKAKSAP